MSLDFCCGFGCEIPASGQSATGAEKHWSTLSGTRSIIDTNPKYSGKSLRFNSAAATAQAERNTSGDICVIRTYVYFESFPDVFANIIYASPNSGISLKIQFNPATSRIRATDGTTTDGGVVVTTGKYYLIDVRFTVNGTTAQVDWSVDNTVQSGISVSHAGTSFANYGIGWTGAVTATVQFAEFAHSSTSGDYPIGEGKVIPLFANRDGTHSFSSGTFKYDNSTNVDPSATDVWQQLTGILGSSGLISQNVVASGSYVEIGFDSTGESIDARCITLVSGSSSAGTSPNRATLRMNDGGTLSDVYAATDISETANFYLSKSFGVPPSGGTWTQPKINAILARWGFSTDVSDVPFIKVMLLEVEYSVSGETIYFLDSVASGSNMGAAQLGGSAPAAATTGTGWTVGTVAASNYARMAYGVERSSASFGGTAQPSGAPDNTLGDCFRTQNPLSGTFIAGVWVFLFTLRAVSAAGGQDGRIRVRVWKSANANGSGATEITSGTSPLSSVTDLAVGVDQNSTGGVTLPQITLNSEYLFFQVAWEITGAAS
jgi:hypothetical protein